MDGYDKLGIAVVKLAAKDYQQALIKLKLCTDEVEKLKRFFYGDSINNFTTLDRKELAKKLEQEVVDYNYNYRAILKSRYPDGEKSEEEEWP